jgi:ubiquinone/menaquinone biosynthesis C-methylase UbiE
VSEYGSVWESRAQWWKETFADGTDPEYAQQIVPRVIECVRSADHVIDIGAGEGQLARAATSAGAERVVAIDSSAAMVELANGSGVDARVGDVTSLPFESEEFDLATIGLVLEHVGDFDAAVSEVARVLKPSGRVLLFLNHPMFQTPGSGWIDDQILEEQYWRVGPYLQEATTTEEVESGVLIPFAHRPLSTYVNTFARSGLMVRQMDEPSPPTEFLASEAGMEGAEHIPRLLFLEFQKIPVQ